MINFVALPLFVTLGVVMAHEQAHARHRHDRCKLLAVVATAFIPPVARHGQPPR